MKVKCESGEGVCWCSGGELLHVLSAASVRVPTCRISPPIAPVPLSLGMSAFWGTEARLPRERTQRRRRVDAEGINKISCVSPWSGWFPGFVFLYADLNAREFMSVCDFLWATVSSAHGLVIVWQCCLVTDRLSTTYNKVHVIHNVFTAGR